MNKRYFKLILTFLCFIIIFSLAISKDETEKGLVTYVEGSAKKQKLQDVEWRNIDKDTLVAGGERVRTLTQSRAELSLAELDIIRMAPKTTIDIMKLYQETKENIRESKIVLQKGDLWANVNKNASERSFSIGTPVAAAAITGTTLRMHVEEDSSSEIKVYSGEVELSKSSLPMEKMNKSKPYEIQGPRQVPGPREVSLEEWTIIVKSMQKVRLDKKGNVLYSGAFTDDDKDEQSDWVLWNKKRDQQ